MRVLAGRALSRNQRMYRAAARHMAGGLRPPCNPPVGYSRHLNAHASPHPRLWLRLSPRTRGPIVPIGNARHLPRGNISPW
ncbi:MAG: hypothetical protein [Cressdnaviricota sp.]|nr:MAG: hypothetical protein [Cressdnaviricota sp.]